MSDRTPAPDDWRRQGQERYLAGAKLFFRQYHPYRTEWDHDHCEFCNRKFLEGQGDLTEGYTTADNYRWICPDCFEDFKREFHWTVEATPG